MRAFLLALAGVLVTGLALASPGLARTAAPSAATATPQQALVQKLQRQFGRLGAYSGAEVVDLNTGQTLYAASPDVERTPASVEKLYTTTAALLDFGPQATLTTSLLGAGGRGRSGTWYGSLYLRGGGDPTFGSAGVDIPNYGGGATIQRLVANLQHRARLTALKGRIVGDGSYFDSLPSTVESGFAFDPYMEGSLSAISFNRDLVGSGHVRRPTLFAAQQLAAALRAAHVRVPRRTRVTAGRTPATARLLASVTSPSMATLIALTNTPSDNFFAEMLTKGLGARFGAGGTTASGVAVIQSLLDTRFALTPSIDDGSGLSRYDATSPTQVVTLLSQMASNPYFTGSLAVAGQTGTLQHEMNGTPAEGACRGKTGTLSDVASLAGYCQAADGHTLAFALLANRLGNPALGHLIEANMAVALADYDG